MTIEQKRALAMARARLRLQQNRPGTVEDMAKSGASGMARGTADLIGLPGTIADALGKGMNWLGSKGYEAVTGRTPDYDAGGVERFFSMPSTMDNPEENPALNRPNVMSGEAVRGYASAATGGATDYQPQTTAGEYARTIGEFLPGAAAFGGMSPSNIARYGLAPAVASEAAGQFTEGTAAEPWARTGAALAAPFIANRLVTPFKGGGAERNQLAQVMDREGVPLSAGQRLGNTNLLYKESQLAPQAARDFAETQGNSYTRAVLKRIGVDADAATPQVIQKAADDIGQQFDDLTRNYSIGRDTTLVKDLQNVRMKYMRNTGESTRTPALDAAITDVIEPLKNGKKINGALYQNLRSDLGEAMRSADGQTQQALRGFIDAMDDAMERAIRTTNPKDVGKFAEARRLYKNLLVVERAATGAGENARLGIISPQQLRSAAINIGGRRGFARGKGDFAELARAGEATMTKMPDSGTASRLSAMLPGGLSGAGGAGIGASLLPGNPVLGGMAGAAIGAAVPNMIGKAALSPIGRAYLGNQVLPPVRVTDPRLLGPALLTAGRANGQ